MCLPGYSATKWADKTIYFGTTFFGRDWPETSMASSLAFQHSESQKYDNLPQILCCQEKDADLFPFPNQQGKVPAQ